MIRRTQVDDCPAIYKLYKDTAFIPGGIARFQDEITTDYIESFVSKSVKNGLSLVLEVDGDIIGEIHAYKTGLKVFNHVLTELTICIHPRSQGKQFGRKLFCEFMRIVINEMPDIQRVELIARESNKKAISFYQSLGFEIEGALKNRICSITGKLENDIPMGWIRNS